GYDHSTFDPCNICPKPILWNYWNEPNRRRLYKVWAALIKLRIDHEAFETTNYSHDLGGATKRIWLNGNTMDAVVLGNFDVASQNLQPGFQHTGWWYEYFTGDSLNVIDVNMNMNFTAGEYRLYTDSRLPLPDLDNTITDVPNALSPAPANIQLWPNPTQDRSRLAYTLPASGMTHVAIYDLIGREVKVLANGFQARGDHRLEVDVNDFAKGRYLVRVVSGAFSSAVPLIVE
ncbi:MAG: T9SS type A sorting domain-containing protein, partial [Bacteroidota bacterium]